jgi:type IV secretory pathway TrbL component
LDLAITLIVTTALITLASFFLGFAALQATAPIAKQTLDVILSHCVKLLGIYLVVASSSQTLTVITNTLPTHVESFDSAVCLLAVVGLFWGLAKSLPSQLARIVTGTFQETQGLNTAAIAFTAARYSQLAKPAVKATAQLTQGMVTLAGSTLAQAGTSFTQSAHETGNLAKGIGAGVIEGMAHVGKAVTRNLAEHFKHLASHANVKTTRDVSSHSSSLPNSSQTAPPKFTNQPKC